MRVTKKRLEMLDQLKRMPGRYEPGYAPLKALVEAGLARRIVRRDRDLFEITSTGNSVLQEARRASVVRRGTQ